MNNAFKTMTYGLLISMALCGAVWAGPTWICAITAATACRDDGTTGVPDLGGLERPTFLRVDLDAKKVTILAPASRRGEVSAIESIQQGKKSVLMAGVERGRAWTLMIADEGHLTISVTDDGEVWSVFGNACREEDLKPSD